MLALVLLGLPAPAAPPPAKMNKVAAVIDPPTLINLGFEWIIQGDDKRDEKADMSYRQHGEITGKRASGDAPELGALESGQPMPHYGPAPRLCAKREFHTFSVRKNHVQEA